MTDISRPGEFKLVDRPTKDIQIQNQSAKLGIGDDCAVMHYPDKEVLMITGILMEGVHLDLTYIDMQYFGYKSAMTDIDDIFTTSRTPKRLLVSLTIDKRSKVGNIRAFYSDLQMACSRWYVDIVEDDMTSSRTGIVINITCIGEAKKGDIVYHSGTKDTNLICISDDLGTTYMGSILLEREKDVYYQQVDELNKKLGAVQKEQDNQLVEHLKKELSELDNSQPGFAREEYLLQKRLQIEVRRDIIEKFQTANIHPTAMIGISGGLSGKLFHICEQSKCGCGIYEKNLPVDYQTAVMAEELSTNTTACALNGDEDCELLLTIPIPGHERIQQIEGV